MKRLIFALVCMAAIAAPAAVNLADHEATQPSLAPQHGPGQLPALGPLTQVAHIYGNSVDFDADFCQNRGFMIATINLTDLNTPTGEQIDTGSVLIQIVDFDRGGLTDNSQVHETEIEILAFDTGCTTPSEGTVAATVTGSFTNGETFFIQVLAPAKI